MAEIFNESIDRLTGYNYNIDEEKCQIGQITSFEEP